MLRAPCPHGLRARPAYLLKRLFRRTIRRKPVGSVTELSLLFISSNCWSMMSPASLSVSLLAQALWEKCRESQSERKSCAMHVCCVVLGQSPAQQTLVVSASLRPGHPHPPQLPYGLLPTFVQCLSRCALFGGFRLWCPLGWGRYRKELCRSQYCTPASSMGLAHSRCSATVC